jgi:hypothetical protein
MRHVLTRLGRDDLEAAVMRRHRRSGLPLRFVPPAGNETTPGETTPGETPDEDHGAGRRWPWSRTPSQDELRRQFFTRLHEACGPNVTLALFYWVRAVTYDPHDGTLVVRPLRPLSFRFLEALSLAQQFSLKAFLDHATLTAREHSAVTRVSRGTSLELLESLANLLLIESVSAAGEPAHAKGEPAPAEAVAEAAHDASAAQAPAPSPAAPGNVHVDDATRYRLRPVVVRPVIEHLRRAHIIH